MEPLKYALPESLLSLQSALSSREDHMLRKTLNENDDPDRHSKVKGKRRRANAGSASLKSVSGRIALVGLLVRHPRSSPSPQTVPFPSWTNFQQSKKPLRTMMPACQSSDENPDLVFRTTAKYQDPRYDPFLEMPHDASFPIPGMTDPWGDESNLNLLWNSPQELPFLSDGFKPLTETDAVVAEAVTGRSQIVSDRIIQDTPSIVNTTLPRSEETTQLGTSASSGGRLSHVLEAVAAAGFDSLDDAVVAYYVESLKDNERLRLQQRLGRIRRLPALLKQLHLAAQGWGKWQRRQFQEQMIKSTEDIVIAELEDHLAAKRPNRHNSTCSTGNPCQACKQEAKDVADYEAELPNTWALMTSLSTNYNAIVSKDSQANVPEMISKFLATSTNLGT
ncbi:hypothetical protein EK21DRAFT_93606 [Setomelanomma holmii]|uniref:Uncharacterized protein n=1 Tax=Setomelanomma holmii TaxID=210430 RepID=A0A9P4H0T6_9PLEO|nr:hypothetical protein EK21DRAFT_93606 [Setomelanomma holmii]